jgi:hypothetical protein
MLGYGYLQTDKDNYIEERGPKRTGISIIDLESKTINLIFSIRYLVDFAGLNKFAEKYHFYVTHTSFSKNDSKMSFMLRWTSPENSLKRYSILYVYDINSKKLKILPTDYMVSHYVWFEEKILIYARINKIDKHFIIDPNIINESNILGSKTLTSDGHQTINPLGEIVVDTYPNRRRIQKLFYFKDIYSKGKIIGEFYHPKKFQSNKRKGHVCVDLHPRISDNGKFVSFDSAYNGLRNLCILKLK